MIHGPFHSAKTNMLYKIMTMVEEQNTDPESICPPIACRYISLDALDGWAEGEGLEVNRSAFFQFLSYMIFEERMDEGELKRRLYSQHTPVAGREERSERLCLLIDEMQEVMCCEDADMQKGVEDFFRFVWNYSIPVVGAGTFELKNWNWRDSLRPMTAVTARAQKPLRPPYNKPTFCQWPQFTSEEVTEILNTYERRIGRIDHGLRPLIHLEANGHAASLMVLLRLVRDERPTVDDWDIMLEAKYTNHMNGFRLKISAELEEREDVRSLVRKLLVHKDRPWEMNLDKPSDMERHLLNVGIIVPTGPSKARFTSSLVFRASTGTGD
ncbi:hypothetical protein VTN77DRAFT_1604 [Rasamsonia byssochlamydoides]|uniref:uncharacterized protein n=1 Tax=Rasamsonia byssochlamydoides TaxID=89139 RepID=UPI003744A3FD